DHALLLCEQPIGDEPLAQLLAAREPTKHLVQTYQHRISVALESLPRSHGQALKARRKLWPEPLLQVQSSQRAPDDRPAQGSRVGALSQGFFVLFELPALTFWELHELIVVSTGRLVEALVGCEPPIEIGVRRLAFRKCERGAGAHSIGEDRSNCRVVSV